MMWGHVDRDLLPLHEGLLDETRASHVRRHLERCARCRERLDAIRFSHDLLRQLPNVELHDADIAAARTAMLVAVPVPQRPWRWLAVATACIVLLAGATIWIRAPRLHLATPPAAARSLEAAAVTAPWSVRNSTPNISIGAAQQLVESHSGVRPRIKASRQRELIGVQSLQLESAPVSLIRYDINHQPVMLAVAQSRRVADLPPSKFWAKHVEVRRRDNARVFTWSSSGDAYSLVVPNGVPAAAACAICHEGTSTLAYIRSATRGL